MPCQLFIHLQIARWTWSRTSLFTWTMWAREGLRSFTRCCKLSRIDNLLSQVIYVFQIIIVLFGVVGLGWGYTIQQFSQTVRMQLSKCLLISFVTFEGSPSLKPSQVYILGAGLVLASLLTIPPWGIYRLGHNHLPLYIWLYLPHWGGHNIVPLCTVDSVKPMQVQAYQVAGGSPRLWRLRWKVQEEEVEWMKITFAVTILIFHVCVLRVLSRHWCRSGAFWLW